MTRRDVVFVVTSGFIFGMGVVATQQVVNPYYFFAGYIIVQYVALATAWNVLGGYAGYINFGPAAFYGAGVYASALLFKALGTPLWLNIVIAGSVGMILGIFMGYLTLRIKGVYFAIATVALVVMFETILINVEYLGGARGVALVVPEAPAWTGGRTQSIFLVILAIAILCVGAARWIESSWMGRGLRAVRADEDAAECAGVPTMRLKLLACALSGAMLALTGAPYIYYASFVEPGTAFSLTLGLNAIAMPLIGGTRSWPGPVIGALLLATVQQTAAVTITSELNILLVGLMLIIFVTVAPGGILGLFDRAGRRA